MKYKIILKTSVNTINRVGFCMNTWLKDKDYVCLTDTLTGRYNEISGSVRTDYYSAEEKTVHLINLIKDTNQFDEYDWLAFVDDDAILNTKMFEYLMPYFDKNNIYGLKMHGSYPGDPTVIYPSGGSGYFISPSLPKKYDHMIDNKWGVEDASVGKWIQRNNIPFEDHLTVEGRRMYLKLNGWFPFSEERKNIPSHEGSDPIFSKRVIENIVDSEKTCNNLNMHMTHHYMRWAGLMEYVYNCFQKWTPECIEPNFSR